MSTPLALCLLAGGPIVAGVLILKGIYEAHRAFEIMDDRVAQLERQMKGEKQP